MNSKTDNSNGRKRAEGTVSFGVSAFPVSLFEEWDRDCKEKFGDCRWIKMWNDHIRSKDYEFYKEIVERIERLEQDIVELKGKKMGENTEPVKTFTKSFNGGEK